MKSAILFQARRVSMLDKNLQIMKVFKMNPKIIEAAERIPFHFSGNIYTMPEKLGKLNDY